MGRKFVLGIAVIAFLTVELFGVQGADAQRLRNLFRRNNNTNCNNCCQGCGVPSESMGAVVQGQGSIVQGTSAGTIMESSANYGMTGSPIVEQPFQGSTQSYSGESYGQVVSAPMYEQPIAQSTPTQSYIQPYAESYAEPIAQGMPAQPMITNAPIQAMPMEQSNPIAQTPMATPYYEGMPTTEYPISSYGATPTSVMPVNYEMAEGCTSCGNGNVGNAGWSEGQIIDGGSMGVPMQSQGQYIEGGIINQGEIINQGAVIDGGSMQGQVLGCATGDCGGTVGGASYGGGVIYEGAANGIQESFSDGSIVGGQVQDVNVASASDYTTGNSAETIISSEIVSESPIEASESTGGETTIESPATDGTPTDAVPDAPTKAPSDDGKEA